MYFSYLKCSLKNWICINCIVIYIICIELYIGRTSWEGFSEAVWQQRPTWIRRHYNFCFANCKHNLSETELKFCQRISVASSRCFNVDHVHWGQAESNKMSLNSHSQSLCLCINLWLWIKLFMDNRKSYLTPAPQLWNKEGNP